MKKNLEDRVNFVDVNLVTLPKSRPEGQNPGTKGQPLTESQIPEKEPDVAKRGTLSKVTVPKIEVEIVNRPGITKSKVSGTAVESQAPSNEGLFNDVIWPVGGLFQGVRTVAQFKAQVSEFLDSLAKFKERGISVRCEDGTLKISPKTSDQAAFVATLTYPEVPTAKYTGTVRLLDGVTQAKSFDELTRALEKAKNLAAKMKTDGLVVDWDSLEESCERARDIGKVTAYTFDPRLAKEYKLDQDGDPTFVCQFYFVTSLRLWGPKGEGTKFGVCQSVEDLTSALEELVQRFICMSLVGVTFVWHHTWQGIIHFGTDDPEVASVCHLSDIRETCPGACKGAILGC
jgi:hypothetical protein